MPNRVVKLQVHVPKWVKMTGTVIILTFHRTNAVPNVHKEIHRPSIHLHLMQIKIKYYLSCTAINLNESYEWMNIIMQIRN